MQNLNMSKNWGKNKTHTTACFFCFPRSVLDQLKTLLDNRCIIFFCMITQTQYICRIAQNLFKSWKKPLLFFQRPKKFQINLSVNQSINCICAELAFKEFQSDLHNHLKFISMEALKTQRLLSPTSCNTGWHQHTELFLLTKWKRFAGCGCAVQN